MEGKVFYVWFDAPIEYIAATAEWAHANGLGDAAWRRWWRADEGAADVRYVQFMGKDNVPFHTLSFPATILGFGRAVEARRLHQVLQLPELRGRQVLHQPGPRRLHGPGARDPARRLLALVADVERPRGLGFELHLGELPGRGEQGPRRRPRQLRQPRHQVRRRPLRRDRPRRRRLRPRGGRRRSPTSPAGSPAYEANLDAIELRKAAQELRAIWVVGNEYLQAAAPWTAIKTDRDRAAAITRFSLNLIRLYAVLSRPFIPDAADAMLAALGLERRRLAGRRGGRARSPAPRATPSPSRPSSSPSSTTPAAPSSRPASPALRIKPTLKSGKPLSSHFPAAFQPQRIGVNL